MADIVPFRKPKLSEKFRNRSLCSNGLHKWKVDKAQKFDVSQGKLVTVERCVRCGQVRNRLT